MKGRCIVQGEMRNRLQEWKRVNNATEGRDIWQRWACQLDNSCGLVVSTSQRFQEHCCEEFSRVPKSSKAVLWILSAPLSTVRGCYFDIIIFLSVVSSGCQGTRACACFIHSSISSRKQWLVIQILLNWMAFISFLTFYFILEYVIKFVLVSDVQRSDSIKHVLNHSVVSDSLWPFGL